MNAIAYSSPFVPAEWIAAHGLRPQWLRPPAAAALARGVCPYAGALIEAVLSGIDAAGLVLTTACDQMRGAAALLESRADCPIFLLNVPSTWQTAASRELYRAELRRLGRFLVRVGGQSPTDADLTRVMLAHDRQRNDNSRRLTASERAAGIPLAVLGGPLWEADRSFFELVERAGGQIVLDATEGAERTLPRPFDPARVASNPVEELADAYFDAVAEVFRRPNTLLYEWLERQLAAKQVRGIIFRRYVWCDLWHAELQRLKQWSLVPLLEIDIDSDDAGSPGRVEGRIEAFLETLKGRAEGRIEAFWETLK